MSSTAVATASIGDLIDSVAGRHRSLAFLARLAGDEAARKELRFEQMIKGWAIGSREFMKDRLTDHWAHTAARALSDDDPAGAE